MLLQRKKIATWNLPVGYGVDSGKILRQLRLCKAAIRRQRANESVRHHFAVHIEGILVERRTGQELRPTDTIGRGGAICAVRITSYQKRRKGEKEQKGRVKGESGHASTW